MGTRLLQPILDNIQASWQFWKSKGYQFRNLSKHRNPSRIYQYITSSTQIKGKSKRKHAIFRANLVKF